MIEFDESDQAGFIAGLTFIKPNPVLIMTEEEKQIKETYTFIILDLSTDGRERE